MAFFLHTSQVALQCTAAECQLIQLHSDTRQLEDSVSQNMLSKDLYSFLLSFMVHLRATYKTKETLYLCLFIIKNIPKTLDDRLFREDTKSDVHEMGCDFHSLLG